MATLQIFTKEPEVKQGEQVVYFRRKKVAEDQAYRAVVIPAFQYSITSDPADTKEVFAEAISAAVADAAGEILKAFVAENPSKAEMPEEMLTFAAVLAKMGEQQTSQRLNAEQIRNWYKDSETAKDAATRYGSDEKGKQKQAALASKYESLASNNPGIDNKLAEKMIAYVNEKDLQHSVCKAILKRLERLTKEKVDADEL